MSPASSPQSENAPQYPPVPVMIFGLLIVLFGCGLVTYGVLQKPTTWAAIGVGAAFFLIGFLAALGKQAWVVLAGFNSELRNLARIAMFWKKGGDAPLESPNAERPSGGQKLNPALSGTISSFGPDVGVRGPPPGTGPGLAAEPPKAPSSSSS